MQKDNPLFEDLSKLFSGATGALFDMKREIEAMVTSGVESWVAKMNLVTREEFDVVRAMAEKAREENEALRKELESLKKA